MESYTVVVKGKPEGPFTLDEMKELSITPSTFVRKPGMDDYKEAHEMPELRELLGIKAQVSKPQYFATLDLRLLAIIIDYFLVFAVYCVLATVVVFLIDEKESRIKVALSGLAVIPIVKIIYSIISEASSRQGTYGKFLLGLKVTDEAGLPISTGVSLARNLSKLLCIATLGFGYIFGFFDKRQQCIHDKIAGTLVIKDRLI